METEYTRMLDQIGALLARQALGLVLTDEEAETLEDLMARLRASSGPPEDETAAFRQKVCDCLDAIDRRLSALESSFITRAAPSRTERIRSGISDLLLGASLGLLSFIGLAVTLFLLVEGLVFLADLMNISPLFLAFLGVASFLGLALLLGNKKLANAITNILTDSREEDLYDDESEL
ncbi:hypothetical protein [Dysosmobacter sp.]|uniref:hypothetical protein n=1 Tax=Dysosmobacter sp. TaxID=2591382 RepID=UPI002A8622C3|nr:hypothetical protein [Dysosmobacter sp.]MDY3984168.1 hypothetical protein [Dysosmobacter sp.]